MADDLLTSTIIFTVGKVVATFCGCGGRIVTGTHPKQESKYFVQFHTLTEVTHKVYQKNR